uniref:Probable ATP-dependent transporter ycf16 n=1 Tax=Bostrychia simpliciuscula TaxID=324754 RepID=A0A1Z1M8B0_9FLOR|nr:Iron-sulfur cluster formation ABC transporterATP-binding subunit [Bostrychia simpliciuscula]ARW62071.1 Iron-sulfur cluster formation ABC transporterATP-binding subunit [Bostrychia simpliciuscula]
MTYENILTINNLHATINDKPIINGLNLLVKKGEIHAIMGKNGSGKSTLAKVIAGHPNYKITQGKIILNQNDITYEDPDIRSHKGIFLAFQYPIEIPGVSNVDFLRFAYNSKQKASNKKELDPLSFFELINQKLKNIDMDSVFLNRNVNEGFSGGEKKKNEVLQMSLLNSQLCILDEIDSGLDVDALKNISNNISILANQNNSIILITHYQRLLDYIKPNYIHVMHNGKIIHTGSSDIAIKIEKHGYDYIKQL